MSDPMPRQAIILAAGAGTRLRPLTDDIPKCMVPIGGRPLLEHTIRRLRSFGVDDIVVTLHHLPDRVTEYFGDGRAWDVKLTYAHETELLGTAGGVKQVASHFRGPFFVWYGDNLSRCDLGRLHALHCDRGGVGAVALFFREDPTPSGIVGLDDHDRITRFLEKPRPDQVFSHWISAGIFVLEPGVLDVIAADRPSDFGRDVFPHLVECGDRLFGYRLSAEEGLWWIDTLADLHRTEYHWQGRAQP